MAADPAEGAAAATEAAAAAVTRGVAKEETAAAGAAMDTSASGAWAVKRALAREVSMGVAWVAVQAVVQAA